MDCSTIPCVIFAFNRPEKLKRIFEALKFQGIEKLIVFVDGPRNQADQSLVEASREMARQVDWAEKELHFWQDNHGLLGLLENISLVLEEHPAAVFVEDDCLPMPGFMSYMRQSLVHYEGREEVFSIGGYQPVDPGYFQDYPYSHVSCARFMCWGWATWRDRWQDVYPDVQRYERLFDNLNHVSDMAGIDIVYAARAARQGEFVQSWDTRVALACLWQKKVHLLPSRGLVRNIGQDSSGIHRGRISALRGRFIQNRNISEKSHSVFVWLENLAVDCAYTEKLKTFVRNASGLALKHWIHRVRSVVRRSLQPHKERLFDLLLAAGEAVLPDKRALFSYIVYPFSIPREDPRFYNHINIWHATEIVRILNRLGYIVDLIDYRDESFIPEKQYDLFFGHGGFNFAKIAKRLPASTKRLYFATGSYWKIQNQREVARFEALRQRREIELPFDRQIPENEEEALSLAEGIIGIGNAVTKGTYSGFPKVVMVGGNALFDDHYEWCQKDFDQGRMNFIFFSGSGNVHKGLDLLLEAFVGLEEHLWVCSRIDSRFENAYYNELHRQPNIHLVGWVRPRSSKFYDVMEKCNFSILPSASEGQAQSIVECLNQGLIPIVSKESGLDVDDFGFILETCSIQEIRRVVQELSSWNPERLRELSHNARLAAINDFSEEAFTIRMTAAIRSIVKE